MVGNTLHQNCLTGICDKGTDPPLEGTILSPDIQLVTFKSLSDSKRVSKLNASNLPFKTKVII